MVGIRLPVASQQNRVKLSLLISNCGRRFAGATVDAGPRFVVTFCRNTLVLRLSEGLAHLGIANDEKVRQWSRCMAARSGPGRLMSKKRVHGELCRECSCTSIAVRVSPGLITV